MPLISLDHVSMAFGHVPLLDDASLSIEPGERVSLVGRNGTGKSTLLQIVAGDLTPDSGSIWRQPGLRVGRLAQDAPLRDSRSVFEVVAEGLGDLGHLVTAYHHAAVEVAERGHEGSLERLGRLQHELEERDGWTIEQRVELVLARLDLPAETPVDALSGGWRRRVLLARALVAQPDLLLLDEPTNHLDVESMIWLETCLTDYPAAVMFVTHDRVFLQRVATRILELDRGRLTSWPGDYETFRRRKEGWLASEATQNEKFDKRLAQEEAWLRQGIKARRTRNEGRVRALLAMRETRAARRDVLGAVRMQVGMAARSGRLVFEAEGVCKTYGTSPVVLDASVRVMRGDRIGLIGPNGSGKTTLLRILIGDLPPDRGDVRRGANVQVAYYDQQREQLDPERTVFDTIADGRETVTVNGVEQHVHGYLRDFLFPLERAASPVRALSGGERNRLLLARLFARPANVLVLDEPTNDLDIETLELLEARLLEWPGTVLLVSHDRALIDHVVTSTLVFESGGRVHEYVGGYADWLRQRDSASTGTGSTDATVAAASGPARARKTAVEAPEVPVTPAMATATAGKKLSYHEQQELLLLPDRIEELEREFGTVSAAVADPQFYRQPAEAITAALARQEALQSEVLQAYERWSDLDERARRRVERE
jgi:ATP-binding cassette subfamily F protein uup